MLRGSVTLVGGTDRLKPQRCGRNAAEWEAALQLWLDHLFGGGSGWTVSVKDRPEDQRGKDPLVRTVWRHDLVVRQPGVGTKHRTLLVPLQAARKAGKTEAELEALAARVSALGRRPAASREPSRAKRQRTVALAPLSPSLRRGEETAAWLRSITPPLLCLETALSRLQGRPRLALRHFAALAAAHQNAGPPHTVPAFLMVADLLGATTPADAYNFTRALHALGAS